MRIYNNRFNSINSFYSLMRISVFEIQGKVKDNIISEKEKEIENYKMNLKNYNQINDMKLKELK